MINEEKVPVKVALETVDLKKSSYYYRPKPGSDRRRKPLDGELVEKIEKLSGYELVYGYRKVAKELKKYNHKKVYRHMKALNKLQPRKLKKKNHPRLPMEMPESVNERWEADLTYVWDGSNTNYLFAVIDAYDKEIIGDRYGLRCRAEEAIESLERAVEKRFGSLEPWKGIRAYLSLRVDQGSQYLSKKFRRRARELGIKVVYCGISCPDDKPYIESFFSRYKCEEVYRREYCSYRDAYTGWLQYKQWYNTERIHQGLNWMTIPEFKKSCGNEVSKNVGFKKCWF
jgi:putative transposase